MKTETGCRPDQLFGVWAIEPARLAQMVEAVRGADLQALRSEAKADAGQQAGRPLYALTKDGIALVEISGPMTKYPTSFQSMLGGTSTVRTREALRAAGRDPEVLAVMVLVDSPGGTVAGTGDLADDIRRLSERKPVDAYVQDLAASAAVWAASGARHVWANASAEIGSIGVYSVVRDVSGAYAQEGVRVHVISSAAPLKGAGVEGSPVTTEQLAEWERRVKDLANVFVEEVARGRRMEKGAISALATGQVWVAEQARQRGLIDGVLSLDEALARLRSEAMSEQETQAALAMAAESEAAQKRAEQQAAEALAAQKQLAAQLAETSARLKAMEAKERASTFASQAEALKLPSAAGPLLERIEAATGAEIFGQLHELLRGLRAQIDDTKLLGEIGTSGAGPAGGGEAWPQIEAIARQRVAKGDATTFAEAVASVVKEHPELYSAHVSEMRKGS